MPCPEYWKKLELNRIILIGHSIGEYTAACLAGVFDLQTALKIVIKRGHLMKKMPSGNMMAVRADFEKLKISQMHISKLLLIMLLNHVQSPSNLKIMRRLEPYWIRMRSSIFRLIHLMLFILQLLIPLCLNSVSLLINSI